MPSVPPESGSKPGVDNKMRPNAAKMPEAVKYTDVERTSSASFKPPMSKDPIAKKKPEVPPPDSSWFTPISYFKNMFGGKGPEESAQVSKTMAKPKKPTPTPTTTVPVKNASNTLTKDKVPQLRMAVRKENQTAVRETCDTPTFLPETVSEQHSTPTAQPPKSPRFSYTPEETKHKRVADKTSTREIDPNAPKYSTVRHVENKSTYLHAPDKKGTTSFRITTSTDVKPKLLPLTPKSARRAMRMKKSPATVRKSSASPQKVPKSVSNTSTTFPTRLRSKSTPDHSSVKPRLPYNPPSKDRWNSPTESRITTASPAETASFTRPRSPAREIREPTLLKPKAKPSPELKKKVKKSKSNTSHQERVLSWVDYERNRIEREKEKALQRLEKELKEGRQPDLQNDPKVVTPPRWRVVSPDRDESNANRKLFSPKSYSTETEDRDKHDISPAIKAIETFMGEAMGVLSTKISTITKAKEKIESMPLPFKGTAEEHKKQEDKTVSQTKSETSVLPESPHQKSWFAKLFDSPPSPIVKKRQESTEQTVSQIPTPPQSHVTAPVPVPVVKEPQIAHNRPSDRSAYIKSSRRSEKTMRNFSGEGRTPVKKSQSTSPERPIKRTPYQSSQRSPSAKSHSPSPKKSVQDISTSGKLTKPASFKAALGKSPVQETKSSPEYSPNAVSSPKLTRAEKSNSNAGLSKSKVNKSNSITSANKSSSKTSISKSKIKSFFNLNNGKTSPKATHDMSGRSSPKMKSDVSSFLKSAGRHDSEAMSKDSPYMSGQHDSPPKHSTVSKSHGRSHF